MTYGEFLRYCRLKAGVETKSEFARKLGFIDNDHYIGSENDKEGKKPSLDLLERAARATGHEFTEAIHKFEERESRYSPAEQVLHNQLHELLNVEHLVKGVSREEAEEVSKIFTGILREYHWTFFRGGRRRRRR